VHNDATSWQKQSGQKWTATQDSEGNACIVTY
jgi:hypothetical protein